ncbi:dUTP diphosphatase [Sporosarcina aquimarina]|uniref:dUTP diphosphatase n=1 Tax=Sporosarcina aquimarina TaxID=114975 RepID=A0ABU4G093_9BACL|nr:dUTP diphosphatase [Sporosarcina aquimarina]MDW0110385.1 dUTP diphosphatase [Sporosarcina aquimarina]
MDMKKLFNMQLELDTYIQAQHGLSDQNLFEDKVLALLVELSELANETRCFKFWSTKGPSERSVILEEYVDSIHFLLSLGIIKELTAFNDWRSIPSDESLTATFIKTNHAVLVFNQHPNMQSYIGLWDYYGILAEQLGFSTKEIVEAYIEKNEKNYERQKSGY